MFNKNSALVQIWIRLIKSGTYTISDVPKLFNLQDVVIEVIYEGDE